MALGCSDSYTCAVASDGKVFTWHRDLTEPIWTFTLPKEHYSIKKIICHRHLTMILTKTGCLYSKETSSEGGRGNYFRGNGDTFEIVRKHVQDLAITKDRIFLIEENKLRILGKDCEQLNETLKNITFHGQNVILASNPILRIVVAYDGQSLWMIDKRNAGKTGFTSLGNCLYLGENITILVCSSANTNSQRVT